jgi:hypothetical protein
VSLLTVHCTTHGCLATRSQASVFNVSNLAVTVTFISPSPASSTLALLTVRVKDEEWIKVTGFEVKGGRQPWSKQGCIDVT